MITHHLRKDEPDLTSDLIPQYQTTIILETTKNKLQNSIKVQNIEPLRANAQLAANSEEVINNQQNLTNGIYLQYNQKAENDSIRLMANHELERQIEQFSSDDFDADGDDDIFLSTRNSFYLKTNHTNPLERAQNIEPLRISWQDIKTDLAAPSQLRVNLQRKRAVLSFQPSFDNELIGMELLLKQSLEEIDSDFPITKRILLLPPEQITRLNLPKSIIVQPFAQPLIKVQLPGEYFWQTTLREIRTDGKFSNRSLPIVIPPYDLQQPNQQIPEGNADRLYRDLEEMVAENQTVGAALVVAQIDVDEGDHKGTPLQKTAEPENNILNTLTDLATRLINPVKTENVGATLVVAQSDANEGDHKGPPRQKTKQEPINYNITLKEQPLYAGTATGKVSPNKTALTLWRKRQGQLSQINTSSSQDGKYFANKKGKYEINDFSFNNLTIVYANNQSVVTLVPKRSSIESLNRQLIIQNQTNTSPLQIKFKQKTIAEIMPLSSGKVAVKLIPNNIKLNLLNVNKLPTGVYLQRHADNNYYFGNIPLTAPQLRGGGVIYNNQTIVAAISAQGQIVLFNDDLSIKIKKLSPLLRQIVNQEGKTLFTVLVKTTDTINQSTMQASPFSLATKQLLKTTGLLPIMSNKNSKKQFTDVPVNHPAFAAINKLHQQDMVEGFSDGSFRPDNQLTRAEFVKLTLAASNCSVCSDVSPQRLAELELPFWDAQTGAWYLQCLNDAKKSKLVNGYADRSFRPNNNISRAEAVAVLLRSIKQPLLKNPPQLINDLPYRAWYRPAIWTAVKMGLINVQNGYVFPEQAITRAEFAIMAAKVLDDKQCQATIKTDMDISPDYCPNAPEDRDGDQDHDGCPDIDLGDKLPIGWNLWLADGLTATADSDYKAGDKVFTVALDEDGKTTAKSEEVLIDNRFALDQKK